MRKKGLEIGVNAIVVLVFAVTVLGLGLAFISGAFNDITKNFMPGDTITKQMIEKIRESNVRLAFDVVDLSAKRGDKKEIYFGIRNELDTDATFTVNGQSNIAADGSWDAQNSVITCFNAIDETARATVSTAVTFRTLDTLKVVKGEVGVLKLEVKVSSAAKPTTYSCAMVIKDPSAGVDAGEKQYARNDFFVTVA